MLRKCLSLAAVLLLSGALLVNADPPLQQVPSATPVQINLSPVAPPVAQQDNGAPTPTRTATPVGIALLEAKDFANVRADPSTDSAQLGTIRAGDKYNVIGRYISWIQFEYQASPTGKGWVFGDLVTLTGNTDNIPNIDPFAQTPGDSIGAGATGTQTILTQTPGGVLTATLLAQSQNAAAPGTPAAPVDNGTQQVEPTFTYPPGIVPIAPTPGASISTATSGTQQPSNVPISNGDALPPLVPILILGGVGLLGLAISALRRG